MLSQGFGDEAAQEPPLAKALEANASPQLLRHAGVQVDERLLVDVVSQCASLCHGGRYVTRASDLA